MRFDLFRIRLAICVASFLDTSLRFVSARPDTYVHLFGWSWPDIERECREFLGPKGYAGVQISPPVEHADLGGLWYERYQPASYKLDTRSGSQAQLESMMRTCNEVGVKIYADVVFNHMASGCGVGYAGTRFCNRSFEVWELEDFHHAPHQLTKNCKIDWANWSNNNATGGDPPARILWNCDLVGLPDLATERPHVQQLVAEHLRHLIDLGARGLRIDAAKHMQPEHLKEIFARAKATGWFPDYEVAMELYSNEIKPVKPSMYLDLGNVEYFDYSWIISQAIAYPGHMGELRKANARFAYPSEKVNVFLDNHDTQRNGGALLTYRNSSLYVLANVFMLAWPYGYPKVMSSFYILDEDTNRGPPKIPVHVGSEVNCQDGKSWVCEHRIPAIANMVSWRKVAGLAPPRLWTEITGSRIAFARGSAFVALNRNLSNWKARLPTSLPAGVYCDISQSDNPRICPYVVVDESGFAEINVPAMSAVAFHNLAEALVLARGLDHGTWISLNSMLLCAFGLAVGALSILNALVLKEVLHRKFGAGSNDALHAPLLSVEAA